MKHLFLNILLLFSFFLTAEEPVQHGKEHDFMLVASPSSGSSFFFSELRHAIEDKKSKSERFSPIFSRELLKNLINNFDDSIIHKSFYYSAYILPENYLRKCYRRLWDSKNYQMTKEVALHFQISFFQKFFTLNALYRHRKYTFPTSKEAYYLEFYDGFLCAPYDKNEIFEKTQYFLKSKNLSKDQQICASHIVFNYALLSSCGIYNIPVIDYEKIITLNEQERAEYLKTRIPAPFYGKSLSSRLSKICKSPEFLLEKEQVYQELEVEPFCQELIAFMKELDPDMPYWYLLE